MRRQSPAPAGVRGVGATRDKGERRGEIRNEKERVTGMRVGMAEDGSGTELAGQNHSSPDRFATRLGFSPLPSTSSWRELRLRAGVSLRMGFLLLPQSRMEGESHYTPCKVSPAGGGALASPGQVSEPLSDSSSFQPTDWASVQDRCLRQRGSDQHLLLWPMTGLARFAFLPKEASAVG